MLYSIHQALHVWLIWVYMIFTCFNGLSGILGLISEGGLGFLFYAMILCFYFLAVRKIYIDSNMYRNGGTRTDFAGQIIETGIKNVGRNLKDQIVQQAAPPAVMAGNNNP